MAIKPLPSRGLSETSQRFHFHALLHSASHSLVERLQQGAAKATAREAADRLLKTFHAHSGTSTTPGSYEALTFTGTIAVAENAVIIVQHQIGTWPLGPPRDIHKVVTEANVGLADNILRTAAIMFDPSGEAAQAQEFGIEPDHWDKVSVAVAASCKDVRKGRYPRRWWNRNAPQSERSNKRKRG